MSGPEVVAHGLTSAEAAARLARNGPNLLPVKPPVPVWWRVAGQLRDPLIIVLLVAAVLTAVTGDWADMTVILLVVVVNTGVGVAQEVRAERAITALTELTAPVARVVRDGAQRETAAAEVVTGDLLVLAEGDIVAADARVEEAAALLVDESALTGESVPVDKAPGDDVSAGTVVVRGRGRAEVTAVGAASAAGRIAGLMVRGPGPTPLQRRLAGVGRLLAGVAVLLCVCVGALGLVRGQPVELMVVTAISLVVAAVPESLPAVVTLSLALGARRMAARDALVRRLHAVETLGSITVLATDKTGTLTEGRMVVRRLWTPAAQAVLTGSGYDPDGRLDGAPATAFGELLTAAALCNDARLVHGEEGRWRALGDPTEAALLTAAAKLGLDRADLQRRFPRVAERPFDSVRKRMTTLHRLPGGQARVICKGAPEALLLPQVLTGDAGLPARAAEEAERLARDGYRVLAVAQADLASVPEEVPETGLTLLGLIAILDPPRRTAPTTIAACHRAGIRPVLITGDHPGTARAIATELGIIAPGDPVIDCRTLTPPSPRPDVAPGPTPGPEPDTALGPRPDAAPGSGPDAALGPGPGPAPSAGPRADARSSARADAAPGAVAGVYARATPEQKLDLIEDMRAGGSVVAMTGDGVNDGPALRRADIGVAMGRRGTEVARQAADLVLADDNLDTVVAAVEEGRRVYTNIRRFLVYGLSGGAAEIAVMLVGPFLGLAVPLLPAQILWINLLTHGLPGVALGGEPADPAAMTRPPRPPDQSVLGAGLWQRVIRIGFILTVVTLGIAVWALHTGRPWQTMAFFALGATQLGVALGSRIRPGSTANPMLLLAVAGALVLQVAALYLPPLADLLGTRPLPATDLLIVAALSVLGYVAARLDRILHREPIPSAEPNESR